MKQIRLLGKRCISRDCRAGLLLAALAVASSGALYGQRITARIVGTVTDPTGAIVPNANVTGTNRGTGLTSKATTNSEGYYVLTALPVGEYVLSIEAPGFRRLERSGINLGIDQTARVDLLLELGGTTDAVSITAEAPLVNSENIAVNTRINSKQVTELPISFVGARSILDFMMLRAGIANSGTRPYESNDSINGSPQTPKSASVDGTSIGVRCSRWYLIRPAP